MYGSIFYAQVGYAELPQTKALLAVVASKNISYIGQVEHAAHIESMQEETVVLLGQNPQRDYLE